MSAAQGSSTVFIKNLPWSATEDQIYEFFQECGEAVNVRIGKPLGARCGASRLVQGLYRLDCLAIVGQAEYVLQSMAEIKSDSTEHQRIQRPCIKTPCSTFC